MIAAIINAGQARTQQIDRSLPTGVIDPVAICRLGALLPIAGARRLVRDIQAVVRRLVAGHPFVREKQLVGVYCLV